MCAIFANYEEMSNDSDDRLTLSDVDLAHPRVDMWRIAARVAAEVASLVLTVHTAGV